MNKKCHCYQISWRYSTNIAGLSKEKKWKASGECLRGVNTRRWRMSASLIQSPTFLRVPFKSAYLRLVLDCLARGWKKNNNQKEQQKEASSDCAKIIPTYEYSRDQCTWKNISLACKIIHYRSSIKKYIIMSASIPIFHFGRNCPICNYYMFGLTESSLTVLAPLCLIPNFKRFILHCIYVWVEQQPLLIDQNNCIIQIFMVRVLLCQILRSTSTLQISFYSFIFGIS